MDNEKKLRELLGEVEKITNEVSVETTRRANNNNNNNLKPPSE